MKVFIHCVGVLPIYYPFLLAVKAVALSRKDVEFNFIIRDNDKDNLLSVEHLFSQNIIDEANELHLILAGLDDYWVKHPLEPTMVLISRMPLFGITSKETSKKLNYLNKEVFLSNIVPSFVDFKHSCEFEKQFFGLNTPIKIATYKKGSTVYNYLNNQICRYNDYIDDSQIQEKLKYEISEFGIDDLNTLREEKEDVVVFTVNPWLREKEEDVIVYRPPEEFQSFTHIFCQDYKKLNTNSRDIINILIKETDKYIARTYLFQQVPNGIGTQNLEIIKTDIKSFYGLCESNNGHTISDNLLVVNIKFFKGSDEPLKKDVRTKICMWLPGMKCTKANEIEPTIDSDCCLDGDLASINDSIEELIRMCSYYRIFGADYDVLAFPEKNRKTDHYDAKLRMEGKADLLPSLSHAIGTELGALVNKLSSEADDVKLDLKIAHLCRGLNTIYRASDITLFDTEFQENEILKRWRDFDKESLSDNDKRLLSQFNEISIDVLKKLFPYFMTIKPKDKALSVIAQVFKVDQMQMAMRLFFTLAEEIKKINRAILRMDSIESNITISDYGRYSIIDTIYQAIIVALEHFYGQTIFGNNPPESAYREAFTRYWGDKQSAEEEGKLWKKYNLYFLNESERCNGFLNWQEEYRKITKPTFNFALLIDNIRYDTSEGVYILKIFFEEMYLNAFKYGAKTDDGPVEIHLTIKGRDAITNLEFSNGSINPDHKSDGEGEKLINKVMREKLLLKPENGNQFNCKTETIYSIMGRS